LLFSYRESRDPKALTAFRVDPAIRASHNDAVPHRLESFRLAQEILDHRQEWREFQRVLKQITAPEVLAAHRAICDRGGRVPAGGQSAINELFRQKLRPLDWIAEPRLFDDPTGKLRGWKMDFIKNRVGVEITFNHAEAVPWIFSRLNIAGESERVQQASKIEIGIAVFATTTMRDWGRMDNAVGTFELATAWLREMKPILPIPLLLVGLDATGWPATDAFRGTSRGTRQFR
jgi:hypothetical protein